MLTITFDPIWIPVAVSVVAGLWFAWWTFASGVWSGGWFYFPYYLLFGVALPAFPSLIAWLVWAVFT